MKANTEMQVQSKLVSSTYPEMWFLPVHRKAHFSDNAFHWVTPGNKGL